MSAIVIYENDGTQSYVIGSTPTVIPTGLPFDFPYFFADEISVRRIQGAIHTLLAFGVDYTVTGVPADDGFHSGTVNLQIAVSDCTIRIDRTLRTTKATNFPETGAISIPAMNTLFSRLFSWVQDLSRRLTTAVSDGLALYMPKAGGTFTGPIELNTANVDIGFRPTDGIPGQRVWYLQANDDGTFVLVAAADDYTAPTAVFKFMRDNRMENLRIAGNLLVDGETFVTGNVAMAGGLAVTGNAEVDGGLTVNGNLVVDNTITAATVVASTAALVPNRTAGDATTNAANTAFVAAAISTVFPGPGGPGGQVIRDITISSPVSEILLYSLGVKSVQVFFRLAPTSDGAAIFSQFATGSTLYTGSTYYDSNLFGTGTTASFAQVGPAAANKLSASQSNLAVLSGSLTIPWIGASQMYGNYAGAIGTTGALITFSTGFVASAGSPNGIRLSVSPGNFAVGSTVRVIGWP